MHKRAVLLYLDFMDIARQLIHILFVLSQKIYCRYYSTTMDRINESIEYV